MDSFLQKIKLEMNKFKTIKVSYERDSVNPGKDWAILLTIALVILCIMAIVSFYFYTQVSQGTFFVGGASKTGQDIKIDMNLLKKTVDDINLRESLSAQIRNNRPNVADPSL
jgi:hypothetical protein